MTNLLHCPIITTRLVIEYIFLPVLVWLVLMVFITHLDFPVSEQRIIQGSIGIAIYILLFVGYGHGINKLHSPDYSLKFSSLFFAGPFGCWLSYVTITNGLNGYLGCIILFCAINSFLYYQHMLLAIRDQYLKANRKFTAAVAITNLLFLCINTLIGLYNMIQGKYQFML